MPFWKKFWVSLALVFIAGAAVYLYRRWKSSRPKKEKRNLKSAIPGPVPKNNEEGHLGLIKPCGSLHEFLSYLHARYGPIVAFSWGKERVVSTACPSLFKEQVCLSDRPASLFRIFEPFYGKESISFANGPEAQKRRIRYAWTFSDEATKHFFDYVQEIADSTIKAIPSESEFGVKDTMFDFAIKSMLRCSFGVYFDDDTKVTDLREAYYACWADLESRLDGSQPEAGSDREKAFEKNKQTILEIIKQVVDDRKANPPKSDEHLFVDVLLEMGLPEETMTADMLDILVSGFQTTALLLTWCQYYLASNPGNQERVYEELTTQLEDNEMVTVKNIHKLKYLSLVIDETLRCSTLTPYTARCSKDDVELGGYMIPAETPIIQALGVVHEDPKLFSDPEMFEPGRFSGFFSQISGSSPFSFAPYGFAGERKCFGYKLALIEANVWLSTFIRQYRIEVANGEEIHKAYGFVTEPSGNITLQLVPR